ncbi:MAG: DUF4062 domain-containing protein [Candidatus Bathyarchaeia archaeon]
MPTPPPPTPVDNQIVVFVSSKQKEFQQLRDLLKTYLEGDDFLRKNMIKVELADRRHGERIRGDITQALRNTSIYVGLFGNKYSEITIGEYLEARRRGLPVIIFDMVRRGRRDPLVREFLEEQVKKMDDCRITPLNFQPSKIESAMYAISQGIAHRIADLAQQNIEIRKTVHPQ